jgi:23S rRNA (adenine2503-C2)-methyltransferase
LIGTREGLFDSKLVPNSLKDKLNIKELGFNELETLMISLSQEPYRAKQIWDWLYKKKINDINLMSNISRGLRQSLKDKFYISMLELADRKVSRDGTQKFTFQLEDQHLIETVWIKMDGHNTLCLSSQVGCRLGCLFCLTGQRGWVRNLSVSEIIDQILAVQNFFDLNTCGFNLVFMGMGEPLDNYQNVIRALRVITSPYGLAISPRRITLSTVGLVQPLKEFIKEFIPVNLAVSLNATTDRVRDLIIPINKNNPIKKLLSLLKNYPLPPRRRITIQYVLIEGINDSLQDALRLVSLLKGIRCKVNLIPFNSFPLSEYRPPRPETVERFQKILLNHKLTALIRESKGADICGACGQLGSISEVAKWTPSLMP